MSAAEQRVDLSLAALAGMLGVHEESVSHLDLASFGFDGIRQRLELVTIALDTVRRLVKAGGKEQALDHLLAIIGNIEAAKHSALHLSDLFDSYGAELANAVRAESEGA